MNYQPLFNKLADLGYIETESDMYEILLIANEINKQSGVLEEYEKPTFGNKDLPMSYRLWKNEARRLLRKVLTDMCDHSEGNLLLDEKHKAETNQKVNYWPGCKEGKLLNEIDKFLNSKSSLTD